MARTRAAIETEIKQLEASGQGESAKAQALWAELEDVDPANAAAAAAAAPDMPGAEPMLDAGKMDGPKEAILKSDEARFVDKCLAEMKIEFGRGNATGAVKRIYNDLLQKVVAWRIAQEIMLQVGVGGAWPQWSALNRNEATGERLPPKPPAPPPVPHPATPATVAVTEGGMPVHARPDDPLEQEKAMRRQMMAGLVGSRPEVARTPVPVA